MAETLESILSRHRPKSDEWKNGPKITKQNLIEGNGPVEHLHGLQDPMDEEDIIIPEKRGFKKNFKTAGTHNHHGYEENSYHSNSDTAGQSSEDKTPLMNFGKYKNQTMNWVKSNDPHYWVWCLNEIEWFAKKAEKAGLN